jgi:hypothetical protein
MPFPTQVMETLERFTPSVGAFFGFFAMAPHQSIDIPANPVSINFSKIC